MWSQSNASPGIIDGSHTEFTPRYVRNVRSRAGDSSATVSPLASSPSTTSSPASPNGSSCSCIQRPM